MRRWAAVSAFVAAWLVLMLVLAPMRWLGELAAWQSAGLSATGATGTIWNGRLLEVKSGAYTLGDIEAGLSGPTLLTGTLAIALQARDGRGTLLLGRERGLRGASGQWPMAVRTRAGQLEALLSLEDFNAVFRGGRCHETGGNIGTTLELPAAGAQAPRLVLSGSPICREGIVEASLLPAPGSPAIELLVQARADGHYRLAWTARAPEPGLQAALAVAGFIAAPEGMVRVDEGRLGHAGPLQE